MLKNVWPQWELLGLVPQTEKSERSEFCVYACTHLHHTASWFELFVDIIMLFRIKIIPEPETSSSCWKWCFSPTLTLVQLLYLGFCHYNGPTIRLHLISSLSPQAHLNITKPYISLPVFGLTWTQVWHRWYQLSFKSAFKKSLTSQNPSLVNVGFNHKRQQYWWNLSFFKCFFLLSTAFWFLE